MLGQEEGSLPHSSPIIRAGLIFLPGIRGVAAIPAVLVQLACSLHLYF